MTDPRTGLPAARLIEEQLRNLMFSEGWTYVEMAVEHLQPFREVYGFVAADEVLRHTALLLNEAVGEFGTDRDFIGHSGGENYVLISFSDRTSTMIDEIRQRFEKETITHYNFLDAEQGGIGRPDGSMAPLMSLAFGVASDEDREFADIREITEAAAAVRQADRETAAR